MRGVGGQQNERRHGADQGEAKSGRRVDGQQDRSEGANQRAADRTDEAVDRRLQRPTDAALGNDDGRQRGPVALRETEGSGQRIGERGRNYHAQDEPEAGAAAVLINDAHQIWTPFKLAPESYRGAYRCDLANS